MKIEDARRISIRDYLAGNDIHPQKSTSSGSVYFSPFREDANPSFYVDNKKNLFHDKGTGQGGSFIDLIMLQHNLSFSEAMKFIEKSNFSLVPHENKTTQKNASMELLSTARVSNNTLFQYAQSRGISATIVYDYCLEVRYMINKRRYVALAFKNDSGGIEIRSEYFKGGNSPKAITTIRNDSQSLFVFEGFFDFLSWLQCGNKTYDVSRYKYDFLVLNSLSMLSSAIKFVEQNRYAEINCYLDNDTAGKKALERLKTIPGINVHDLSYTYSPHNDLNEALVNGHFAVR